MLILSRFFVLRDRLSDRRCWKEAAGDYPEIYLRNGRSVTASLDFSEKQREGAVCFDALRCRKKRGGIVSLVPVNAWVVNLFKCL